MPATGGQPSAALPRERQQVAIASLGQRALAGIEFRLLLDQAVSVIIAALEVAACGVFALDDADERLVLQAGGGWTTAATASLSSSDDTYPGRILATTDPIVWSTDTLDPFFAKEGVVATVAATIPGLPRPYGVLLVAERHAREFSRDDRHFIHAVANVIGAAFERRTIERELRAAVAMTRATLDAAAEGIIATDAAGRVTAWNRRLVDMWEMPADIVATQDFGVWARWGSAQCAGPEDVLAKGRVAMDSLDVETTVITLKDGRVFERHSQPQVVDGQVAGRVWCFRDLTTWVRAEADRRHLEAHMQHVQKLESLGVLAGGIAHDFNNLLVGILGNASLALTDVPADSPHNAQLRQIETAARCAADLTGQLLAYSGKGRFIMQRCDLSEVVSEMASLLQTAVSKRATLQLDLTGEAVPFEGDPTQLRQVVMNLITNAADAMSDSGGHITLKTGRQIVTREYLADVSYGRERAEGDCVFVEVDDTGCGMDEATVDRMFDPFFTTKFTGRGLGLAAVLGIVRGHNGAIKIITAPGGGTTIRVLLPASASPVRVSEPVRPAAPVTVGGRVLVVDDEATVRRVAAEVLRRAGFDVMTASDGVEAVSIFREDTRFDAVLLDMTMPRMNGAQTYGALRQLSPSLRVVLTSGYSEEDVAAHFKDGDISGFVRKPFLASTLVRTLTEAVYNSQHDVS